VKQDVIPGIVASVWFTPKETGRFDIACSGLCGPGHDQMKGAVVVESATEFAAFLAREAAAK
jgi:cytochrome c oxidase subunit 2